MSQNHLSIEVEIAVPAPLVWSVMADVERWPEWTASVSHVKALSPGPLQVGSLFRIRQPKLPSALWRVAELNPGTSFTWISSGPGVRVTARHTAETIEGGTRVTLSVHYEGWLGPLLARWVGDLNASYLTLEANGLMARCADAQAQRYKTNNRRYCGGDDVRSPRRSEAVRDPRLLTSSPTMFGQLERAE